MYSESESKANWVSFWKQQIFANSLTYSEVPNILRQYAVGTLSLAEYQDLKVLSTVVQLNEADAVCELLTNEKALKESNLLIDLMPEVFRELLENGFSPWEAWAEIQKAIEQAAQVSEYKIVFRADSSYFQDFTDRD